LQFNAKSIGSGAESAQTQLEKQYHKVSIIVVTCRYGDDDTSPKKKKGNTKLLILMLVYDFG